MCNVKSVLLHFDDALSTTQGSLPPLVAHDLAPRITAENLGLARGTSNGLERGCEGTAGRPPGDEAVPRKPAPARCASHFLRIHAEPLNGIKGRELNQG